MKLTLAIVWILGAAIPWTASNVHRHSTVCPHASTTSSADDLDAEAYNAAIDRFKSQLFRAFEKYGVSADGDGNENANEDVNANQANEDADAILKKIREVLPPDSQAVSPNGDDEEQATLYMPLPYRDCSGSNFRYCFTIDIRGIDFDGEKDGALNLHVTAGANNSVNLSSQLVVYEARLGNASELHDTNQIATAPVHIKQAVGGTWVKIPINSTTLKRWHSKETQLVVVIRDTETTPRLLLDLHLATTRPYLELAPQKIRQRSRRSADRVHDHEHCHVKVVEVDTAGIDKRITAPHKLKLQYCTGVCSEMTIDDPIKRRVHHSIGEMISLPTARCCVPATYLNVSVMWSGVNPPSLVHLNKAFPASCTCV